MKANTLTNAIRNTLPFFLLALHKLCIANDVMTLPDRIIPCTLEAFQRGRSGFIDTPFESGVPFIAEAHHRNENLVDNKLQPEPEYVSKIYRDSMGRIREETLDANGSVKHVNLLDPVAGSRYSLDGLGETGFIMPLKAKSTDTKTPISEAKLPPEAQFLCRSLGTRQFDGISADGESVQLTVRDPENHQLVFEFVTESWYSPALKVQIFGSIRNMKSGNFYKKLTHIESKEAAPTLFQPRVGGKIWDAPFNSKNIGDSPAYIVP